jgi:hypothetical protein
MYCNVLEGSIQMELYCNSKTQHTTVKHSQQLSKHTYMSNLYGLGTLTPIEFVQQDLFWSSSNTNWPSKTNPIPQTTKLVTLLINYSLFTLLRDNGTKAIQYCCVAKETQLYCVIALLRNRAPSHCYGNHNTQQYGYLWMHLGTMQHTVVKLLTVTLDAIT